MPDKRKDVWEIISTVSTILTPVLLAILGFYISERTRIQDRQQTIQQNERDALFKKTELLEKFGPYLYDTSVLKNKIGIIGMYAIDTSFALQLATIINSPGTLSAIKALFKSVDSVEQASLENILVKNQENIQPAVIDTMTPGGMALTKAIQEWQAGAKEIPPNSNDGPFVKKYFSAIGLNLPLPWSTAFVVWCYLSNPSLAPQLSFMKTPSPDKLYAEMKNRGFILPVNESPLPGDIVFLLRQVNGVKHAGIVQSAENDLVYTIEGNVTITGVDGGTVSKRVRNKNMVYAFARIKL
jgi:hypothetical protein